MRAAPQVHLGRQYLDRRSDAFHHLGDLTLRVQSRGGEIVKCGSVGQGQVSAAAASGQKGGVAGGSLTVGDGYTDGFLWRHTRDVSLQTTPHKSTCPVGVKRAIVAEEEAHGGGVQLSFELSNPGSEPLTVGSLALSMPFDQVGT